MLTMNFSLGIVMAVDVALFQQCLLDSAPLTNTTMTRSDYIPITNDSEPLESYHLRLCPSLSLISGNLTQKFLQCIELYASDVHITFTFEDSEQGLLEEIDAHNWNKRGNHTIRGILFKRDVDYDGLLASNDKNCGNNNDLWTCPVRAADN